MGDESKHECAFKLVSVRSTVDDKTVLQSARILNLKLKHLDEELEKLAEYLCSTRKRLANGECWWDSEILTE